jgi:hypothetical protein
MCVGVCARIDDCMWLLVPHWLVHVCIASVHDCCLLVSCVNVHIVCVCVVTVPLSRMTSTTFARRGHFIDHRPGQCDEAVVARPSSRNFTNLTDTY